MVKNAEIRFLNVDLDVRGSGELPLLLRELEPFAFVLNPSELNCASLEVRTDKALSLDETIEQFHIAYLNLSDSARGIWHRADYRSFSAGFEVSDDCIQVCFFFSESSITIAAEMHTRIDVTLYKKSHVE